jgi:putative membrane protein
MILRPTRIELVRAVLALCGLLLSVVLGWYLLSGADLALLFKSWGVPAIVLLHLVQQAGCGCAWHSLIEPPRPSRWAFFRIRWIRASVAALIPVTGVGAAIVALRLSIQAGLKVDMASASLTLDATMEMITQVIFTALGFSFLLVSLPEPSVLGWGAATLSLAVLTVALFIAAQLGGGLKLLESCLCRLAARWPRLSPLTEARLHDSLIRLYQQRRATLVSGLFHLGSWLLGAGEIWLLLLALGYPLSPAKCIIIESLNTIARSAGFLVPGALGVQEIGLVLIGKLVGLSPELAILIALVKRLRDIVVGVPGLLVWQWTERNRLQVAPAAAKLPDPTEVF